ncbi:hypothetical protein LINPERPRIM_LOCUS29267, partial [Linum perenne]
ALYTGASLRVIVPSNRLCSSILSSIVPYGVQPSQDS